MALPKTSYSPSVNTTLNLTPTAITAAPGVMVETYTVNGVDADMEIQVTQLTNVTAGCRILDARASGTNQIEITWFNGTTSTVTLGATSFNVIAF